MIPRNWIFGCNTVEICVEFCRLGGIVLQALAPMSSEAILVKWIHLYGQPDSVPSTHIYSHYSQNSCHMKRAGNEMRSSDVLFPITDRPPAAIGFSAGFGFGQFGGGIFPILPMAATRQVC
jgi:hypothetical protein